MYPTDFYEIDEFDPFQFPQHKPGKGRTATGYRTSSGQRDPYFTTTDLLQKYERQYSVKQFKSVYAGLTPQEVVFCFRMDFTMISKSQESQ